MACTLHLPPPDITKKLWYWNVILLLFAAQHISIKREFIKVITIRAHFPPQKNLQATLKGLIEILIFAFTPNLKKFMQLRLIFLGQVENSLKISAKPQIFLAKKSP